MRSNAMNKRKKLQLKRDTLRILSAKEASGVHGGAPAGPQDGSPTASGLEVCTSTAPVGPGTLDP